MNNTKGSALAWVLIIIMVSTIFIAASQMITLSYNSSTLKDSTNDQLLLTSKSMASIVAEDFVEKASNLATSNAAIVKAVSSLVTNSSITTDANFASSGANLSGKVTFTKLASGKIKIDATAEKAGEKQTFTATVTPDLNNGETTTTTIVPATPGLSSIATNGFDGKIPNIPAQTNLIIPNASTISTNFKFNGSVYAPKGLTLKGTSNIAPSVDGYNAANYIKSFLYATGDVDIKNIAIGVKSTDTQNAAFINAVQNFSTINGILDGIAKRDLFNDLSLQNLSQAERATLFWVAIKAASGKPLTPTEIASILEVGTNGIRVDGTIYIDCAAPGNGTYNKVAIKGLLSCKKLVLYNVNTTNRNNIDLRNALIETSDGYIYYTTGSKSSNLTRNMSYLSDKYCLFNNNSTFVKARSPIVAMKSPSAAPGWTKDWNSSAKPFPTTAPKAKGGYFYTATNGQSLVPDLASDCTNILPVIVIVQGTVTFTNTLPSTGGMPKMYFYLMPGSTLKVPTGSYLVAYGDSNSTIEITGNANTTSRHSSLYGVFQVNKITTSASNSDDIVLTSTPLPSTIQYYKTVTTQQNATTWSITDYKGGK